MIFERCIIQKAFMSIFETSTMKRRTLLGTVGVITVGAPGCLGSWQGESEGNTSNPDESEENSSNSDLPDDEDAVRCTEDYVPYDQLPDQVVQEVDTALETGSYETKSEILYEHAVKHTATLWKEETYYNHQIREEGKTRILTFEETVPTHSSPTKLIFANWTDTRQEVSVTVRDGDKVLVDTDFEVDSSSPNDNPSRDGKPTVSVTEVFGRYEMIIEFNDSVSETKPILVNPEGDKWVFLHEDGIGIRPDMDIDAPPGYYFCNGEGGWWGTEG